MGFSLPHHGSPHRNPKRPRPPRRGFFLFDYGAALKRSRFGPDRSRQCFLVANFFWNAPSGPGLVPRAHAAFPDTLGKFAVLSRKFPVLLRREFRRNHLIYRAEKQSLIPFLRLNQRKFPVLSRLTGKIPAETGSLVTASTATT
jgi:hypothetical protein